MWACDFSQSVFTTLVYCLNSQYPGCLDDINSIACVSFKRSTVSAAELLELYEDRDSQRLDEMQAIHGPNAFNEFYFRLKGVRDFHRKHPNEVSSVLRSCWLCESGT